MKLIIFLSILALIFVSLGLSASRFDIAPVDSWLAAIAPWLKPKPFTLTLESRCVNGAPEILLSWSNSEQTKSYTVQRKTSSQKSWEKIESIKDPLQNFAIDKAIPNESGQYYYRVKATNRLLKTFSNEAKINLAPCQSIAAPQPSPSASPVPAAPAQPVSLTTQQKIQWGAYAGWQISTVQEFERKIGRKPNLYTFFVHWGNENEFPLDVVSKIQNPQKTIIIFWQATDYNISSTKQPRFSYARILAGEWDQYIKSFAKQLKDYGQPVILIPFEEMNGDWYPWSGLANGNTPQKHIAAYRYIHDLFQKITNVKFGWAVNHESVPETKNNEIEVYYPGDQYVDYVGANGFNFDNPWQSFSEVFNDAISRLKTFQKPIYIFSFACAQGTQKSAWIADALTVQIPKYPQIAGWSWFNGNKEKDWRVWSDNNSLEAFKQALP